MGGIELRDIGTLLGFGSGTDIIWNIGLYIIFFLSLFAIFRMPDKNKVPTVHDWAKLAFFFLRPKTH